MDIMKVWKKLKYYTLERPILFVLYILIGIGVIGYLLNKEKVALYQSYEGFAYKVSDSYVIELQQELTNEIQGNLYLYSTDMNKRMIVEQYDIADNKIIFFPNEFSLQENEKIRFRVAVGSERMLEKIFVKGGK